MFAAEARALAMLPALLAVAAVAACGLLGVGSVWRACALLACLRGRSVVGAWARVAVAAFTGAACRRCGPTRMSCVVRACSSAGSLGCMVHPAPGSLGRFEPATWLGPGGLRFPVALLGSGNPFVLHGRCSCWFAQL